MNSKPVQYGIIAGVISIIVGLIMYLGGASFFTNYVKLIGILAVSTILIIVIMSLSAKAQKKAQNGFISFREAFSASFITAIISLVMSLLFSILMYNVIDPGAAKSVNNAIYENTETQLEKFGLPESDIEEALSKLEGKNNFSIGNLLKSQIGSIIFLGIVALIIAAIVKKEEEEFEYVNDSEG